MTTRKLLEARISRRISRDAVLASARRESLRTGTEVWLVGGLVRDVALGKASKDVDLVAGRGAERFVRSLEDAFGRRAFRFDKRGVVTWRIVVSGREVDVVDAGRRGLERDLARRDLTVNSIAFGLGSRRIVDPHGGLRDLTSGRLRLPRPGVIREDPIRALRLARFLAELPRFRLDPAARVEASRAAPALRRAAVERIREELGALLVAAAPRRGLDALVELGLLGSLLPELEPLGRCVAGAERPDVWEHTLSALALSARPLRIRGLTIGDEEEMRVLRWALLLHDVAKPSTLRLDETGRPSFHGHEVRGAREAAALLLRLRFPGSFRRRVSRLVLFHLRPHHLADAGAPERGLRRLVRDAGPDLPLLVAHAACDARASGAPDARTRWRKLSPVLQELLRLHREAVETPLPRLVDGRDVMRALGIPPGPEVGTILREVRDLQERGDLSDRAAALRYLAGRA